MQKKKKKKMSRWKSLGTWFSEAVFWVSQFSIQLPQDAAMQFKNKTIFFTIFSQFMRWPVVIGTN